MKGLLLIHVLASSSALAGCTWTTASDAVADRARSQRFRSLDGGRSARERHSLRGTGCPGCGVNPEAGAFGAACTVGSDCETNVCYLGGKGGFCSLDLHERYRLPGWSRRRRTALQPARLLPVLRRHRLPAAPGNRNATGVGAGPPRPPQRSSRHSPSASCRRGRRYPVNDDPVDHRAQATQSALTVKHLATGGETIDGPLAFPRGTACVRAKRAPTHALRFDTSVDDARVLATAATRETSS